MADGSVLPIDRYELREQLAEGGMGAIYLGKKLGAGGFEKEVVLKQLRPEYTEQPEFIELFLREARLSATLDHANIVHTIDLVHAGHDYFMVMEYVRGGDLRVLLKRAKKRKRRLLPAAALYVTRQVLAALDYAHGQKGQGGRPLGLIHRDVSPSNILLSGAGEVKLSDFGIAKATTHRSVFLRVRGKVGYMSPEQARSEPLEPRSDLYSVAVILYEMLTGEKLHVAASLTTSAAELYATPVPRVSSKVPGIPPELDDVLWRGLAVDPRARYQTAREMMGAVREIATLHGLDFDALALARHLVETCGPVEDWRSSVVSEPAAPDAATAGLPPEEEDGGSDLVWVDRDEAVSRARAPRIDAVARFPSSELRPVAEFIADRVVAVAPSLTRPRRRVGGFLAALVVVAGTAGVAVALGSGARASDTPPLPPAPAPQQPPAQRPPVKVVVESEPARARVLVDGQARCMTPCTFDAPAAEPRRLTLESVGHLPWTAIVVPQDGDAPLRARLRREPHNAATWGSIVFRGSAAANILVNGRTIGYAMPADDPLLLPAGEHVFALVPPGGRKGRDLRATVRAGVTTELDVELAR